MGHISSDQFSRGLFQLPNNTTHLQASQAQLEDSDHHGNRLTIRTASGANRAENLSPTFQRMCVWACVHLCCYKRPSVSCKNKIFFFFLEMLFNDMKFPAIPKRNIMFPVQWNSCSKFHHGKDTNQWNVRPLFPFHVLFLSVSLFFCAVSCATKQQSIINSTVCAICLLNRVLKQQTTCANVSTWVLDELNR